MIAHHSNPLVIYASELGYCPGKIWDRWIHQTKTVPTIKTELGQLLHKGILWEYQEKGYQVEVPFSLKIVPCKLELHGRVDACLGNKLVEVKTIFVEDVNPTAYLQMYAYMYAAQRPMKMFLHKYFPFEQKHEVEQVAYGDAEKEQVANRLEMIKKMWEANTPNYAPRQGECFWCSVEDCLRRPADTDIIISAEYAEEDYAYYQVSQKIKELQLKKQYLKQRLTLRKDWGKYAWEKKGERYLTSFQRGKSVRYEFPFDTEQYRKETEYFYPVVRKIKDAKNSTA